MMASTCDCEFPELVNAHNPSALRLLMASQAIAEQYGGVFDPSKFCACDHDDQTTTLVTYHGQTMRVCSKHGHSVATLSPHQPSQPTKGRSQSVSGGYSAAELAGEFSGLHAWTHTLDQRGEHGLKWRTTELSASAINALGGRQAMRDGMFNLSYFTYGYHGPDDARIACLYMPAVKAQLELPADDVEGLSGWESRALLTSICGRADFQDGLNGEGVSLFEREPVVNLAERIAEATQLTAPEARQEPYVASPNRHLRSVWDSHKENITGGSTATQPGGASPGKLPAGRFSIASDPRSFAFGSGGELCESCGALTRRGDGIACSCGHVAGSSRLQPARTASSAGDGHTGPTDHVKDFADMLREGVAASQRHRGIRAGGPPGGGRDPPGDDGDDGDDPRQGAAPAVAPAARPDALTEEDCIRRVVIETLRTIDDSPLFKKVVEEHAQRLHQLSIERDIFLLEQQGRFAALSQQKQEVLAGQIEARREAYQSKLQADAQQHSDEAAERKKVADQFPPGIGKAIAWLRSPGRGDIQNRTGDRTNGKVFPTIGPGLSNVGKLFLALMAAASDPDTKDAFGCDFTEAMCYNILAFRLGGAPPATGMRDGKRSCGLEFDNGSSLHDFGNKRFSNQRAYGVRYTSKEVPKVKSIKFIDNITRSKEHFLDIYALEAAIKNLGKIIAMVFGGALYAMFELCGQRVRELYEYDAHVYHTDLLLHLVNIALLEWTQRVFKMSEDEEYTLPPYQLRLSDHLGFDLPTPTPGDGFARDCPFLEANYNSPMEGDVLTAVRRHLASVPDAVRAEQGFSGLPHVAHAPSQPPPSTTAPTGPPARPRLGGCRSDTDSSDSDLDEDECAPLGNAKQWVSVVDLELGAALGNSEFWERLLGNSPKSIAIASTARKGGTMIKLPRDFLRGMYETFPKGTDPHTGAAVAVCLRYLCHPPLGPDKKPCGKTACSTDPKHPLHRPGENQCNRYHPPFLNPGLLSDLQPGHIALGLVHGGFRCYPRAPSDPIALQAEAKRLMAAQDNNASLSPLTWLGSDQSPTVAVTRCDTATDLGAQQPLPHAGRTDAVVPDWGFASPAQMAAGIQKLGLLRVPGLAGDYVVTDLGGTMQPATGRALRGGANNCVVKTLGAVLSVHGYPEDAYLLAATTEFARTDVPQERQRTNAKFLSQLEGTGKLTLDIVGHVGLPKGVVLVVVQSFETGRVKLVLFTDGNPTQVLFAHISGTHIMPMTPAHKPFGMTWAEFAPVYEAWQVAGGQVAIILTKRCLPGNPADNTAALQPATRVGGADPDLDDEDLMIELGVATPKALPGADRGDDAADIQLMESVNRELAALPTALRELLGLDTCDERVSAVFSGDLQDSRDFWLPFPILHQYYVSRLRRQQLYELQFDPATIPFQEYVWTKSGSEQRPFPLPTLYRSLIHGIYEGADQYASCLLLSVFQERKLQQRQAAVLIALSLCDCSCDPRYATSVWVSDATKAKLASSIGSQLVDWCDNATAKPIVLSHLIVQSLHEWNQRPPGHRELQCEWLQLLVQEYDAYLTIRNNTVGGRYWSQISSPAESQHQRENVRKKFSRGRSRQQARCEGEPSSRSASKVTVPGTPPTTSRGGVSQNEAKVRTAHKSSAAPTTQVRLKSATKPLLRVKPSYYYELTDDAITSDEDALSRRAKRAKLSNQIREDAEIAQKLSLQWSTEPATDDETSDSLAEQPAEQRAEGHESEKQATEGGASALRESGDRAASADEECPAKQRAEGHESDKQATEGGAPSLGESSDKAASADTECHKCQRYGLLLVSSAVTRSAWSCVECEAKLLAAAGTLETAEQVADMTTKAVVSPDTLTI